ncbi:MerR family transcriptional regulator [Clostridium sp. D2Q-11]|uniref:MerR family transcriptional regulator n=1 Tax=Anaeromonas frigoriresistens TaxID=2683708 RepID=A0A942UQ91_9FIRM|nr:MerR family transcriptional regulator [Anaeromonas frigoriresistens]MBS4537299.1 MerR family transcriptional regulator [Anaeromonas frigoriresistens]
MKINELAQKYKISIRTIRYYEEIGLVSPDRDNSNIRVFNEFQVERLEFILFFKKLGIKLAEIKNILKTMDSDTIRSLFQKRISDISSDINRLHNEKQILITVLDLLSLKDDSKLNVKEFVREQIYFQKNNERMFNIENYKDHIIIEIGENLIPLANKQVNGILIDSIKAMRIELENQYNTKVDLIRVTDNLDLLTPNEYRIIKEGVQIIRNSISGNNSIKDNDQIVKDLKDVILKQL